MDNYTEQIRYKLITDKIDFFEEDLQIISNYFNSNGVEEMQCFNFFKLILQTKNLLFKYNLHLVYEPFSDLNKDDLNWKNFRISDGIQTKLEVFYDSNYSLMRIEDNITALYF